MGKKQRLETIETPAMETPAILADDAKTFRYGLLQSYAKNRALIRACVTMARAAKMDVSEFAPSVLSDRVCAVVHSIVGARTVNNNHFGKDDCRLAGDKGTALINQSVSQWASAVLRDGATASQIDSASFSVAKSNNLI